MWVLETYQDTGEFHTIGYNKYPMREPVYQNVSLDLAIALDFIAEKYPWKEYYTQMKWVSGSKEFFIEQRLSPNSVARLVYDDGKNKTTRGAIRQVIDQIENLMDTEDYDGCSRFLIEMDVNKLETAVSLACLSMTFAFRDRVAEARTDFYQRVYDKLYREQGYESTQRLMKGLK